MMPELRQESWERYDLFAALRWLEAAMPDKPPIGTSRRFADDAITLRQEVALTFARTTIASLEWHGDRATLSQHVLGLFGPNGPMPTHLTEYVDERLRMQPSDQTFARFADVFHHRLVQLFYRAWAQGEPVAEANRGEDGLFTLLVDAITGTATRSGAGQSPEMQGPRRDQSAHLLGYHRTLEGLQKRLLATLGHAVDVVPFRVVKEQLDPADRLMLGRPGSGGLGTGMILGAAVSVAQASVQIHFLDLTLTQYMAYQSATPHRRVAIDILRFHLGDGIGWRINLQLRKDEVPKAMLGGQVRLGQTMWLGSVQESPADYFFDDRSTVH